MSGYSLYAADLQGHIRELQLHSRGNDESLWGPADLPHSVIAPFTFWTPEEKYLLFRAVSRHSYLRPDLISQCIGSKSDVEVCCFLQTLREAAAEVGPLGLSMCPAAREATDRQASFEIKASRHLTQQEVTIKRKWEEETARAGSGNKERVPLNRASLRAMEAHLKIPSSMEEAVSESDSEEADEVHRPCTGCHRLLTAGFLI